MGALILMSPVLVKPIMKLPVVVSKNQTVIMARENTLREAKRSSNTAITMLVSIAFIIAVTGMASTFTNGLLGICEKV